MNYLIWVFVAAGVAVTYTVVLIRGERREARFVEDFVVKRIEFLETDPGTLGLVYLSSPSEDKIGFVDGEMASFIWHISRPKPPLPYMSGGKPLTMTFKHGSNYYQIKPGSKTFGLAEKLLETIRIRQEDQRRKDEVSAS